MRGCIDLKPNEQKTIEKGEGGIFIFSPSSLQSFCQADQGRRERAAFLFLSFATIALQIYIPIHIYMSVYIYIFGGAFSLSLVAPPHPPLGFEGKQG